MATKIMRSFNVSCKQCGQSFTFKAHSETAQSFCSIKCSGRAMTARFQQRKAGLKCRIEGCGKDARYVGDPLCYGHYSRLRRKGHFELEPKRERYRKRAGYIECKCPGHPMARRSGWTYEHRVVLYDEIGSGPHPCHWCGQALDWCDIVVDHLNERKDDNRPANLVPSCTFCNRSRGAMVPFIRGMDDASLARFVATLSLMRA